MLLVWDSGYNELILIYWGPVSDRLCLRYLDLDGDSPDKDWRFGALFLDDVRAARQYYNRSYYTILEDSL